MVCVCPCVALKVKPHAQEGVARNVKDAFMFGSA